MNSSSTPMSDGMQRVVALSAPFKIFDAVILLVQVEVIDAWKVLRIGDECLGNHAMHPVPAHLFAIPKGNTVVPANIGVLPYEVPERVTNASGAGNLVPSKGAPNFACDFFADERLIKAKAIGRPATAFTRIVRLAHALCMMLPAAPLNTTRRHAEPRR